MKPILCRQCRQQIARHDEDNLEIDGVIVRIKGLNPFACGIKCHYRVMRGKKEVECGATMVFMRRVGNLSARVF